MNLKNYFWEAAKSMEGQRIKEVCVFKPEQDTCQSFRIDLENGDSIEFDCDNEGHLTWIGATVMRGLR
ncbi:MAG: hypothetical protein NE327_10630 [Lentisphaeraceae bacterium]|nr:hypothetical protein [Lentisphaeraceae bacterium]